MSLARAALGLLLLTTSAAAQERPPLVVRAVSFNVWGLPLGLARDRAARIARIGPALGALRADVACLQEVWLDADLDTLERDLAAVGLRHARRFPSRPGGSGLLIAARWPITTASFTPFTLCGKPYKPWHGDWWGGKGVARVLLDTPAGPLAVANTHLHARYGGDEYLFHQVSQALEAAEAVGDFGVSPPREAHDPARPPLLFLGDMNARAGSLPRSLLLTGADLTPAADDLGIDVVLYRQGGDVAVRVLSCDPRALGGEVGLGDGARGRLSDHEAALAELELRPLGRAPRTDPEQARAAWLAAAKAARPLVEAEVAGCRHRALGARGRGLLLTLASITCFVLGRKRKGKRAGCALPLAGLLLIHLATWQVYLGMIFEPGVERGLLEALDRLGR